MAARRDRRGTLHGRADADHAQRLSLEFIERFAILGSPERCIPRLQALIELGIRRVVVIGPREACFGVQPQTAMARFAAEVSRRCEDRRSNAEPRRPRPGKVRKSECRLRSALGRRSAAWFADSGARGELSDFFTPDRL